MQPRHLLLEALRRLAVLLVVEDEGETEAADRTEFATLGGDEATAAEDPTTSLTLRVVDPEDQPIEGLDVRIEEVQDNRGIPFGLGQDDEEPELYAELPVTEDAYELATLGIWATLLEETGRFDEAIAVLKRHQAMVPEGAGLERRAIIAERLERLERLERGRRAPGG